MAIADGLYWEAHGPHAAPPVILSAGLGGSAHYWTPNLTALAERHRVIVYDHRGTGRSDRALDAAVTIEAMATDVESVLDAAGLQSASLVGHAIGGMIGLALAMARPERLDALVVINGWATLDPHTARCFDTRLTLLRCAGPRAYLHAQPLFLYPPRWISEHHSALEAEEEAMLASFPAADTIERRVAAARRFAPGDRLGTIATPTLLVANDDDMLVPPQCSQALADAIPGAQLASFATGGHACNVTRAEIFNMQLLDWLAAEED